MRLSRSKALSLVAVLLLMAATASPALASMTCLMSGNTMVSWGQMDDCCPEQDKGQATISATCCEMGLAKADLADYTPAEDIALPVPTAIVMPWAVLIPAPLHSDGAAVGSLRGPPDLPGSQCLAVSGVFRI